MFVLNRVWLVSALLGASTVCGRLTYQGQIPNGANVIYQGVAWPGVGHELSAGGGTRNQFGTLFDTEGRTWTRALCEADSDGDGYSNGQELGDPLCTWTVGGVPSRTTDISHPGRADSTPTLNSVTTLSPTLTPFTPTAIPTNAPIPVTPTPPGSGTSPGTSSGGVLQPAGVVAISQSPDSTCFVSSNRLEFPNADGLCRAVTESPSVSTSARYGAAYCDTGGGKIYVTRELYDTYAECTAAIGSIAALRYEPTVLVFDLISTTQCTTVTSGATQQYFYLSSTTCPRSTGGTVTTPPSTTGGGGATVGAVTPVDSTTPVDTTTTSTDDESVPDWMIVVLTLLAAGLTAACIYLIVLKSRSTEHLPTEDDPQPKKSEYYQEPDWDVVDHRPGAGRPQGPPEHSIREMQAIRENPLNDFQHNIPPSKYSAAASYR
eukprot:TRINITY_DN24808_c0_g1_i1.p1 TRINITY_DN24808_c0_g1~~TRINITY_DN24808_c0_g1_i1.p1  ORF type:complete len:433 (+),score=56.58 TRINITY_DN24808_c0_g1_i1:30-1328(+)